MKMENGVEINRDKEKANETSKANTKIRRRNR